MSLSSSSEDVWFDNTSAENCSLDVSATVRSITFTADYTGDFDFGEDTLRLNKNADFSLSGTISAGTGGALEFTGTIAQTFYPKAGQTFPVVKGQLEEGLQGLGAEGLQQVTVAYEPVWAIGTGKTATNEQAQEVHQFIRARIKESFGEGIANTLRILYGGSVKPDNASELLSQPNIDGALVGGASLSADSFTEIVKAGI